MLRRLYNRLNRSLLLILLGRVVVVLVALVGLRIMTGVLSPDQMGRYSVLLAFISAFTLTLVSPVNNYLYRHLVEWEARGSLLIALKRSSLILIAIALCSVAITIAARQANVLSINVDQWALIGCVAGFIVTSTVNTTLVNALNLIGRPGLFVLYLGLSSVSGLVAAIPLTLAFHHSAEAWIIGQALGPGLVSPFVYLSLRQRTQAATLEYPVDVMALGALWAFAWPLVLSTGFYWFQIQGYRIELEHIVGAQAVGLFVTGIMLGSNPVATIDILIGDYYRPRFYHAIANGGRRAKEDAWTALTGLFMGAIIPFSVYVAFSGPFLATILVSAQYRAVGSVVLWGVLIETARTIYSAYVLAAHAALYTKSMLLPALGAVCLLVGLLLPLARWNLNVGAGISLVASVLFVTFATAWQLRKRFSTRLDWRGVAITLALSMPVGLTLIAFQFLIPHPTLLEAGSILILLGALTAVVTLFNCNKLEHRFTAVLPKIVRETHLALVLDGVDAR